MNNWKSDKLKNLCYRIGDGLHGTPEYIEGGTVYFVNGNNLKNGQVVITPDTKTVSEETLENNYRELNENTLLLSINGTLGSMAFYRNEKVMLGKSAAYLNFKSGINKFYYYFFQLNGVQDYFYNVATGSTIKNLGLKSIQNFEVPVPNKNDWEQIAKVLSDLDAKIEVNNKINQELEAMAKTLYDYWFVQFDFPDKNGKPYKSSGGKMVYSEELKREIPEGWDVKTIGHYCKSSGGYAFKSSSWSDKGLSVIKIKDIQEDCTINLSDISYANMSSKDIDEKFMANPGDVLIAMTGATIGKFAIVPVTDNPLYVNQRVGYFDLGNTPTKKLPFLINSLNQKYFRDVIFKVATGAAQPNISNNQINNIKLVTPTKELLEVYNNKLKPTYDTILNNQNQNQKLSELRDWLLPMLMNGQVRIRG